MPRKALVEFLPKMKSREAPYLLHYETKANLKLEEIELCKQAGVMALQPGIESLSSPVLKLMDKGVRAVQNIFTMYSMARVGIYPAWNLLYGFPFELPEYYTSTLSLIPALYHLVPPSTCLAVLVTRYAPLHTNPERFGATGPLKAAQRYELVFTEDFRNRNGLQNEDWAYYFESPYHGFSREMVALYNVVQHQVEKWKDRYGTGVPVPRLTFRVADNVLLVRDSRADGEPKHYRFAGCHAMFSDLMPSKSWKMSKLFQELSERGVDGQAIQAAFEELRSHRIILVEDDECVWIAFDEDWKTLTPDEAKKISHLNDKAALVDPSAWAVRDDFGCDPIPEPAESMVTLG
jgi:hypothetical protein